MEDGQKADSKEIFSDENLPVDFREATTVRQNDMRRRRNAMGTTSAEGQEKSNAGHFMSVRLLGDAQGHKLGTFDQFETKAMISMDDVGEQVSQSRRSQPI